MKSPAPIIDRLAEMTRLYNRALASDAALKAVLGLAFSVVTFGMIFWMSWVIGFFMVGQLGLAPWQFAAIVAGLFFAVAVLSAWRRVDPLTDVAPLSAQQWAAIAVGQAVGLDVFSPRHAIAGAAVILLGGPANVFQALGVWTHRLRTDEALLQAAAHLLVSCETPLPVQHVDAPQAALLLRRLALIKIRPSDAVYVVALTDKGHAVLGKGKAKKKRQRDDREMG